MNKEISVTRQLIPNGWGCELVGHHGKYSGDWHCERSVIKKGIFCWYKKGRSCRILRQQGINQIPAF